MRRFAFRRTLAPVAVLALAHVATACGDGPPPPPFSDTTGEAARSVAYPAGPYGVAIGSVIADATFYGYPAPQTTTDSPTAIHLSDFYNPHGRDASWKPAAGATDDRYFPKDAPYAAAGQLKPTALVIEIGAVWCGPCNIAAKFVMPPKHALYAPCGGEFFFQLYDSAQQGTPATFKNLTNWVTRYKVDYPAAIDPEHQLFADAPQSAYPVNLVVDTTTMKIMDRISGEPIPGTCGSNSVCSTDADCQTCAGSCADGSGDCSTTSPCHGTVQCAFTCGDGTSCTTSASCAKKGCTPLPFWTTFEGLLDKGRAGCTLH